MFAHPNCHQISYVYRSDGKATPLMRFIDAKNNLDLLANGISFTRPAARDVMLQYLGRQGCRGGDCSADAQDGASTSLLPVATPPIEAPPIEDQQHGAEFFSKLFAEELGARDVFPIKITSFLDAYNFDVRRLMKCCTHHVLPSGHVIPFCAYNVLYREGHVAPPAQRAASVVGSH